jgi:hypothetical protein
VAQYGASVQCTADGQVTQAALFSDYDCSIVAFSGSGVGDGVSCIRLSSRNDPGVYFSTVVNCAAPGPEPGQFTAGRQERSSLLQRMIGLSLCLAPVCLALHVL